MAVACQQWQQVDRRERQARTVAALYPQGFGHEPVQQPPAHHGPHGESHEQPTPVQPLQQQGPDQRAEQRRQQGDVGQQRHHAYSVRLAECLVQRRVADRDHKAQAYPLQQAQQVEQANIMGPEGRQAGQAEERAAGQQQRAPTIAVCQRADQPLQHNATEQVQVEGMRDVFRAGVQVADHDRHGRHHRVTGQIGQQFEQGQGQAKQQGPQGGDVQQWFHDGISGVTGRSRVYARNCRGLL